MSKISLWKSILGHKEKVPVDVGGRTELMTSTQSFRFSQLAGNRDAPAQAAYRNPLEDDRYRLEDAAFRLMIAEDDVLVEAAAGRLRLYVDVAGQSGHWCRQAHDGEVSQSTVATIRSGLLKLRSRACADLAKHGRAIVRTLDFCKVNGMSRAGIDNVTLANLEAWGPGDRQFFPLHPLTIEREMLYLLPPLNQAHP